MRTTRHFLACIALVVVYFLLHIQMPWGYFVPPIAATIAAVLVGRISLSFVVLTLVIIGPVMVLSFLFLISGSMWPGHAIEHLGANVSAGQFVGILAPPFLGAATWLALRYRTNRSNGRAQARAA